MKRRIMSFLAAVFVCGTLLAGENGTTNFVWVASERPASAYNGKVTFTYDVKNRLSKIRVTEFPDASNKLTFSGDPMSFTNGNNYVQIAPGEVVFANEVTGTTFFCECIDQSTLSKKTYGYGDTFLTKDWTTVLPNESLEDWDIARDATVMSQNGVTDKNGWTNPDNGMYACAVKRVGDTVTFQYQTDAYFSSAKNDWYSKCVKVEMQNSAGGIQAKALKTTYVVRSATQAAVNHGYDVDNLGSGMTRETGELFVQGKTSGYGVNIMNFVRLTPLATVRFAAPNGSKQISLLSPQPYVNVVLDDASTLRQSGNIYPRTYGRLSMRDGSLYWTGQGNGGDGDIYFEATKALVGEAGMVEQADTNVFFSTTEVKIAENRQLRDLIVGTNRAFIVNGGKYPDSVINDSRLGPDTDFSWCQMNGSYLADTETATSKPSHERHPANLYNLKFTDTSYTKATAQAQCQHGAILRCFYLSLEQIGNDIYVKALNTSAGYSINITSNATKEASWYSDKFLGTDFDLIRATVDSLSSTQKKLYGYTGSIATWSGTDYTKIVGLGVRALKLAFKKPANHLVTSKNPCKIAGGNYVVSGRDDATMVLNIADPGGLPTNGTMTVKAGGELWFTGAQGDNGIYGGVSKGKCALYVEKNGLVRQRGDYPFGETQIIELKGGKIVFEGSNQTDKDNKTYFNKVTLKDGAELFCLTARGIRLGNSGSDANWTIGGSAPSTNKVAVTPLTGGDPFPVHTWKLDVADTGDFAADFVQDGEIRTYATFNPSIPLVRLQNQHVEKLGSGTMLLNGDYSHPGLLSVTAGTFVLGQSNIWSGNAPVSVENGATLEAAAGTSNTTLGTFTVGADGAALVLGVGSTLTFADSTACTWAGPVAVTLPTDNHGQATATLKFTGGVTDAQLRKIRVNGKRAAVTDDGQIIPGNFGLIFVVR